ncbi:MAG: phenylalanine--tRNA ligase subunit beta [Bacilli bacterium]|jgi:phenylalanyl-tRNA synthetase beta chain
MKISLNWVKQYIDLSGIEPSVIADKLTNAGLEVETVETLAVGTHLVTGYVKDARLMENSDHLTVCQVDLGVKYGIVPIVCGAPNVKTGQTVIVARPGAELAEVRIGKSTIRGHESHGMICSLLELGVDPKRLSQASIDGIEVLPHGTEIGREDVLSLLGLDDVILTIKVLANRPDALAVYNVARELSILFERPLKPWHRPLEKKGHAPAFEVNVKTAKCPQFSIRTVEGIGKGSTPEYISRALLALGMRPISPLVDISNYVMLLTGQPLHFYDLDALPEPRLTIVEDLKSPFLALDEKTYEVQPGDLSIVSGTTIACLAGVMGSSLTGVKETTKNIAVEAANFYGPTVRQTSIRLNLPSESSQRFIKGINPHQAEDVLDLTISLIGEVLGYRSFSKTVAHDLVDHRLKRIPFAHETINRRLGTKFTPAEISATLNRIGIQIIDEPEPIAIVPAHRIDIDGVADLTEEVIRIRGFEHIEVKLPSLTALHTGLTASQAKVERLRQLLLNRGLHEVLTYTLLHQSEIDKFRLLNHDELFQVSNPMTDEHEYVRGGLTHSLLEAANYNVARQTKNLAIFEISGIETRKTLATHLGLVLVGEKSLRGQLATKPYDFYDAKGLFEAVMTTFGIDAGRYRYERLADNSAELHPGQSASILIDNQKVGVIATLSPEAYSRFDFKKAPVVMLEIDLGYVLNLRVSATKMSPLSKYPAVTRDLAFVIDQSVEAQAILKVIRKTQKDLIRDVFIFDVYTGEHVPEGKKSLALSIVINDEKKTLTETECAQVIERVKVALATAFNLTFRV